MQLLKIFLGIITISLLGLSCNKNIEDFKIQSKETPSKDTIVVDELVPKEIAVFPNEKEYFIVINKDTSNFSCVFSQINDKKISITFNYNNNHNIFLTDSSATKENIESKDSYYKVSYTQQMRELKLILKKASKDFNLNNLVSINFGKLSDCRDLAIEVTKNYTQNYETKNLNNYNLIEQLLEKSQFRIDLDDILKPYSVSIKNISIETPYFEDKKYLFQNNHIKIDTTKIPSKILNCSIQIILSKN